jgi:hypothetical protein
MWLLLWNIRRNYTFRIRDIVKVEIYERSFDPDSVF